MAMALAMGRRGLGRQQPYSWPSVGCVLVRDGRVVARGTTDAATRRHAERVALDRAGEAAKGATAYVTLEPCAHHGNTPPCADALIAAGVTRVVIALTDPNEMAAGGAARLRAAGIEVVTGIREAEARRDHAGFLNIHATGRPFVTLKLASTLDGRIATASGESRWITGPGARRLVHAMRARHDAVMVGGGTARADDPMLTVRGMGDMRQPVRIVLSRWLDLPADGRLARSARDVPLWIVHDAAARPEQTAPFEDLGAICLPCAVLGAQISVTEALGVLGRAGLTRIFCEGGGALAASLLAAGCVDELVTFHAGLVIGAEGRPAVSVMGLERLADAERFRLVETRAVGGDTLSIWRRAG
mgnify:CR=1 FL=1